MSSSYLLNLATAIPGGAVFEYVSASSIRLTPGDGLHSVRVALSASGDVLMVELNTPLVADLTVAGAGGLDAGAEAANTGYHVYLIAGPAGAYPALLLSTNATTPTLPSGYTMFSSPVFFISNSTGGGNLDIYPFTQAGHYVEYDTATAGDDVGLQVLAAGAAVVPTQITLGVAVPAWATAYQFAYEALHLLPAVDDLTFSHDPAAANYFAFEMGVGGVGGGSRSWVRGDMTVQDQTVFYVWTPAGVPAVDCFVKGWWF